MQSAEKTVSVDVPVSMLMEAFANAREVQKNGVRVILPQAPKDYDHREMAIRAELGPGEEDATIIFLFFRKGRPEKEVRLRESDLWEFDKMLRAIAKREGMAAARGADL